jgi:hypothetical protein
METKETKNMIIKKDGDIIRVSYKKGCFIDLPSAIEDVEARLEVQNGEDCYILTDVVQLKDSTKEAREYLSRLDGGLRGITAGAFVSGSVFSYTILNLYFKLNKPKVPGKFFSNENDALKWFDELRAKQK